MIYMKLARDDDRYCDWSTVADGPGYVYTRPQLADQLRKTMAGPLQSEEDLERGVEEFIAGIDRTGSSSTMTGRWRQKWLTVQTPRGYMRLARKDLAGFMDAAWADDPERAGYYQYLQPDGQ